MGRIASALRVPVCLAVFDERGFKGMMGLAPYAIVSQMFLLESY
jgi:hypothetical protein